MSQVKVIVEVFIQGRDAEGVASAGRRAATALLTTAHSVDGYFGATATVEENRK